jgi:glycosyltransferase involved in cell wall biosynthesis
MTNWQCPIVINSFNQVTYLRNMVNQLFSRECYNIMIIDQSSTYAPLLDYLKEIESKVVVLRLSENLGPHWFFTSGFALKKPRYFVYTDPDIYFNKEMPHDFLCELISLSEHLDAVKIGLALDISSESDIINARLNIGGEVYTILAWEAQFWRSPLNLAKHEMYRAAVDTTFALYDRNVADQYLKEFYNSKRYGCMSTFSSYRIAGSYTATHMPWMRGNPLPPEEQAYYISHRRNIHDY